MTKIITANRLEDGVVVYMAERGCWLESPDGAAIAESDEAVEALTEQAGKDAADQLVVEPYAIDVIAGENGQIVPSRYREVIRAQGPSVRTDLGKQAADRQAA